MNKKIEVALNDQLNWELYSSYLYMSMEAYLESKNFKGMAKWMHAQAEEEAMHARKFFVYINERGGKVDLRAIEAPQKEWDSALAVFEDTYHHECLVTEKVNALSKLSREENDNATGIFLEWFISEQVEEESAADEKVQELKMVGDSGPGLFMLDREMAQRVFTPPATGE